MTDRIFNSISGEASINLEGASRAITLPKDLKDFLLKQGWKNSKVYLVYDDKKECLIVYSREKINKILKNAAGLIWQYKGTEIKENCS